MQRKRQEAESAYMRYKSERDFGFYTEESSGANGIGSPATANKVTREKVRIAVMAITILIFLAAMILVW